MWTPPARTVEAQQCNEKIGNITIKLPRVLDVHLHQLWNPSGHIVGNPSQHVCGKGDISYG